MRNTYIINHWSLTYSATESPLALRIYLILSSEIVKPWIFYYILNPIETNSIFLADGVVVYIVFTKAFKANPYPSYKVMSYLYYCFKNELAATWLLPIAVAFQPA